MNYSEDDQKLENKKQTEKALFINVVQNNCKKHRRHNSTFRNNAHHYFSNYCNLTSIHGIKYLGERDRSYVEKLTWMTIIILVLSCCIFLIVEVYNKWKTTPVVVTFATTETPIWEIPFPAVTICPEVKSDVKIFNFSDSIRNILKQPPIIKGRLYFSAFLLICEGYRAMIDEYVEMSKFVNASLLLHLIDALPDIDPLDISEIHWLGKKIKATDVLSTSLTSEGVCYSFNALNKKEITKESNTYAGSRSKISNKMYSWSLDFGYPAGHTMEDYPRRTFLPGSEGGFIYKNMFVNGSNLDYFCKKSLHGFKIMLHHPTELPNPDKFFRVPLDTVVNIGIVPRMTVVSEELIKYTPEERKCFFTSERELTHFSTYTQQNCLSECFANYTLKTCGCVEFHLLRGFGIPICGPGSNKCLKISKVKYVLYNESNCNCLPGCTSLEYDVEITQAKWNWREMYNVLAKINHKLINYDYTNIHLSKLEIYFKNLYFLPAERHELFGVLGFLSNIGGLLGLFIGISVASGLEIIHFVTLRLFYSVKKQDSKAWSEESRMLTQKL